MTSKGGPSRIQSDNLCSYSTSNQVEKNLMSQFKSTQSTLLTIILVEPLQFEDEKLSLCNIDGTAEFSDLFLVF